MKIEIQKELASRPELAQIVAAANPVLEEAIGPPAARVTAFWRIHKDGPTLELTILDWTGQETATFDPDELHDLDHARRRFYRLWGDLLEKASNRLSSALEAVGAEDQP